MDTSSNLTTSLKLYIDSMIEILDKKKLPSNIDLIIDGNVLNGGFEAASLLYLKELENLKLIRIDRISGYNIGSLFGLVYLTTTLEESILVFGKMAKKFGENKFLIDLPEFIDELIDKYVTDIGLLNDRLYIKYFDVINMKRIVISKYVDKGDLKAVILRSTYTPFLISDNILYKDRYCDGAMPYIFPLADKKILYINLHVYRCYRKLLFLRQNENVWSRGMNGLVDMHNFLSYSDSYLCSYINNWNFFEYSLLWYREITTYIILLIIYFSLKLVSLIPEYVKDYNYYSIIKEIMQSLFKNLIYLCY